FIGVEGTHGAVVPFDVKSFSRHLGLPKRIRDKRDAGRHGYDLTDTGHGAGAGIVETLHACAKNRRASHNRRGHSRHFDVNTEDGFTIDLLGGIEPFHWLADQLESLWIF